MQTSTEIHRTTGERMSNSPSNHNTSCTAVAGRMLTFFSRTGGNNAQSRCRTTSPLLLSRTGRIFPVDIMIAIIATPLLLSFMTVASPPAVSAGCSRQKSRKDAEVGYRPEFLASRLKESALKKQLEDCDFHMTRHDFSIGHRGACLQFPEHTLESYEAAAKQGAGIIECDVRFILLTVRSSASLFPRLCVHDSNSRQDMSSITAVLVALSKCHLEN